MLEVQAVAADRQGVAHAPAGQAVGRPVPACSSGVALHGGLSRAERAVVAEPGRNGRRAADYPGSRTVRRRLPLARPVGCEADPAGLHGTSFNPAVDADAALRVVAQTPAALQHAEILLRPS